MDKKPAFLKYTEAGRYKKVSDISEANYVRLPVEKYVPIREWNALVDENEKLREKCRQLQSLKQPQEGDEQVIISKEDYHGYLNALRIIRERGRQQVTRSHPDKHGYTLKMADERVYDRMYPDLKAYYISRSTPYSLKIDLETANFMIQKDLEEFYNFVSLQNILMTSSTKLITIKVPDLLRAFIQRDDPRYTQEFYGDNSNNGRLLKEFVDSLPKAVSFAPIRVGTDIGNGVYTISYWATAPI